MPNTIKSGDYIAILDYDPEIDSFHGRIANINAVINFYGRSIDELKATMQTSIDTYLEVCRERGIEPAKPFSGTLNLRLGPERHGRAAAAAAATGKSLNAWIGEAIDRVAAEQIGR